MGDLARTGEELNRAAADYRRLGYGRYPGFKLLREPR